MKKLTSLYFLANQIGQLLKTHQLILATAESCTGGEVAQAITSVPGSSHWFDRGFVTYSNAAKNEMLGVKKTTLEQHGAVSAETAKEMAEGALLNSHANISLAITGIAGPEGGSPEKPVGTVWFAWAKQQLPTEVEHHHFIGDRATIRSQATTFALQKLIKFIERHPANSKPLLES